MREVEATVRELLAAARAEQKAKLDAGRVDTVFTVGDRVLLRTKELLDATDIGMLRPRLDGPFTMIACPNTNAYTLAGFALPCWMRCRHCRPPQALLGGLPAPGPVSDVAPQHHSLGCSEPARCSARRTSGDALAPCGAGRVPARGPDRGLVRPGPRGAGRAVALVDRGLGPRDRGTPQQGRGILARRPVWSAFGVRCGRR